MRLRPTRPQTAFSRNAFLSLSLGVLVLGATAAPGCAVVAGTAAGVVLAQEAMDNSTYVVQLQLPAEVAWEEVKVSLSKQATGPLEVDESLKVAKGEVDGRKATVSVESFDQTSSRVIVAARHFGMVDGEAAEQVSNTITADIRREHGER